MRSSISDNEHAEKKRRPRGRPTKNEADQAELRNRILNATAQAYGETGYHGLSVKAVVAKANLSRPTYYRQFSNVEEPLRIVIAGAYEGLIDSLMNQIPAHAGIDEKMMRAVLLYLKWGRNIGPLLRPLYVEVHDPLSPASDLRLQALRRIGEVYTSALGKSGFMQQSPLMTELMIIGIELLGYRYHLERKIGKITLGMIKDTMRRLMACTMAQAEIAPKHKKNQGAKKKV